jgi:hypothetical protein
MLVSRAPERLPALTTATAVKWSALVTLLVIIVVSVAAQRADTSSLINRGSLQTAWRAVLAHRLSLIPSAALLVLSVTAGAPILEQLPDVQRGWIDQGRWNAQAAAAFVTVLLLAGSIFLTTRVRMGYVRSLRRDDPDPPRVLADRPDPRRRCGGRRARFGQDGRIDQRGGRSGPPCSVCDLRRYPGRGDRHRIAAAALSLRAVGGLGRACRVRPAPLWSKRSPSRSAPTVTRSARRPAAISATRRSVSFCTTSASPDSGWHHRPTAMLGL